MPAHLKPRCRFCGRKCKPQGLWSHEKHCAKGHSKQLRNIIKAEVVDDTRTSYNNSKLQLDDHTRRALEALLDNVFA